MKLSNKFLLILLSILILINCFFVGHSSAAIYDISDYKNVIGSSRWCIVYSEEKNNVYLIKTDCSYLGYEGTWSGSNSNTRFYKSMGGITVYIFNVSDNKFYHLTSCDYQQWSCGTNIEFIACNKDVIRPISDSATKTVFQKTPVPSKVLLKATTMEIAHQALEETLEQETMGKQLTILIKIGLIIFGLLLAPFLIKFRSW